MFDVADDALVCELVAVFIRDMKNCRGRREIRDFRARRIREGAAGRSTLAEIITVHEPLSVGRDVGLLDAEIQVGQDLHGLEKDPVFSRAIDLENGKKKMFKIERWIEKEIFRFFFFCNPGFLRGI